MKESSSNILTSPGFLTALVLLLLNDFFLKSYLHNSITGKLSDFAGLFIFPLFWATLFPRFRSWIYLATVGFFILWKSPMSEMLIKSWNSFGLLPISRAIDYTDFWGLTILPVSYVYGLRGTGLALLRAFPALIGLISVFAFVATSFSHKTKYNNAYYFTMPKQELLERMSQLSKEEDKGIPEFAKRYSEAEEFFIDIETCLDAEFRISEKNNQTVLTLTETDYRCPTPPSKDEMLHTFEQEFVEKLIENPVTRSPKIGTVWGHPRFPSPSPTSSPTIKPPKRTSSAR